MRGARWFKYLTLAGMLATVAWFFWNPDGWKFDWEPVVVLIGLLAAFITADVKDRPKDSEGKARPPNESDILLFEKFLQLMPSKGVIRFLGEHDFLSSFPRSYVQPIFEFHEEWDNAEHEFLDEELEPIRKDLYSAVRDFCNAVSKNTTINSADQYSVRPDNYEYSEANLARFRTEAAEINAAADRIPEVHQLLVKTGRARLYDPLSTPK